MARRKATAERDDTNGKSLYPFLDGIQHAKKRGFLVAYCECFSVSEAAVLSGIDRTTHYFWLANDEAYLEAFRQAKRVAAETLESELVRRALRGVQRLKFFKGQPIMIPCESTDPGAVEFENGVYYRQYSEREFSDVLGIFLLKGAMPEKYRERYEIHDGDREINDTIERELALLADRKAALPSPIDPQQADGNGEPAAPPPGGISGA